MKNNNNESESPVLTFIKQSWDTTTGKIVYITVGGLGCFLAGGVALKAATFFTNALKDFMKAAKR